MQSFLEKKKSDGLSSQNRQQQEKKREGERESQCNAVGGLPLCCTDRKKTSYLLHCSSGAVKRPYHSIQWKTEAMLWQAEHVAQYIIQYRKLSYGKGKPLKILLQEELNGTHILWSHSLQPLPLIAKLRKAELLSPLLEASQHTVPVLLNMLALMVLSTRIRSNDGTDEFV